MLKIITSENKILRNHSIKIPIEDIKGTTTQKLITGMKKALHSEKFGVAIAAPQVSTSVRMFIIAGSVFATRNKEDYDPKKHLDQIFINPEIIKKSKKHTIGDEGCLSVPGKYGSKVDRIEKVTIQYYDEHAKKHERGASGFLARVFQHEIDHLNGILYTDEALEVIDVDDDLKPIE